jgi:CRISPR-associated protein Csy1
MVNQESLTTKILEYIQGRAIDKLEKLEKEIDKLSQSTSDVDQQKVEALQQKLLNEKEKFEPRNWLTDAAKRAGQLQFVTHTIKHIHGDAKGSNVYARSTNEKGKQGVLCSQSISYPVIDICGNAAALDVGKLLMQVSFQDKTLVDSILSNDSEPLKPIAENEQQAQAWVAGFKQVFSSKELSSHKLAKQVYWPLSTESGDTEYHLLSPLFASSFAQEVYDTRRKQRDIQFSKDDSVKASGYDIMPNLAVQTYGGTKPQNISQLNSQRGGKNFLLDNRPPVWQEQEKPPLNMKSVFDSLFPSKAYKKAKAAHRLKYYLETVYPRESNFDIRQCRAKGVDGLVDILLLMAASIHSHPAGWSEGPECKLPLEEKLWLDPKRAEYDEGFRNEIDKKLWHDVIADKFATWLNATLQSKTLSLGDVEHRQWKVLVAQELRLTERARKEFY